MKRSVLALPVALVLASGAAAQTPPPAAASPAKLIRVYREELSVGKGGGHTAFESKYVEAFRTAGWPVNYLAMESFTGPQEAWFLEGYDSWAAVGKAEADMAKQPALGARLQELAEMDAAFLSRSSSFTGRYREDLSYRASPPNLAKARYMAVYFLRAKPGAHEEAEESVKILASAYAKAAIADVRWAVYQVTSGMQGNTYLSFRPMASLSELDGSWTDALKKAAGDELWKKRAALVKDSVVFLETRVFSMSPKMSYVSKEFAAQDPEFWAPKKAEDKK